jgi:hypothetical protein
LSESLSYPEDKSQVFRIERLQPKDLLAFLLRLTDFGILFAAGSFDDISTDCIKAMFAVAAQTIAMLSR